MFRPPREHLLAGIGCLAGLLGGQSIESAGFGGFNLWRILIFAIPILLYIAGARAISTFVLAGVSLMAPVQVHSWIFGIRSRYYEFYGIRWEDVLNATILWAGSLGVATAIGLVARRFSRT